MTNIEEAPQPKVLFFQTPDKPDDVTAQVTDPPSPPHTLELGKRERVLSNLARRGLNINLERAILFGGGLVIASDGFARIILGGNILSATRGRSLDNAYHVAGGVLEFVVGAVISVLVSDHGREQLGRIALIRNRWVREKISQIPLNQPPALAEVAPQEG